MRTEQAEWITRKEQNLNINKHEKTCDNCGTVFEYGNEDIEESYYTNMCIVRCPLCGFEITQS